MVALLSAARAGTFPVAPIFRRVAAGALPGLPGPLTGSHLVGPVSAAPPGDDNGYGAAAPYPAYNPKSPLAQGLLKLPVLAASTSLRRSRKAGAARMDAG